MIENIFLRGFDIVVDNGNVKDWDVETIFGFEGTIWGFDGRPDPPVNVIKPGEFTMIDLLVMLGTFPSKSQARKNWKGPVDIPGGYSEWTCGKMRRQLNIWNPTA